MTRKWKQDDYVARCSRRIAELHCFHSEFVWKMIWLEIVSNPKEVFNTRGVLEALWFICGELFQGVYPCRQDVREWLELQPSIGGDPGKKASAPSASKALDQIVSIPGSYRPADDRYKREEGHRAPMSGWFTQKEGNLLALDEGCSDDEADQFERHDYIVPANETASRNVIAIMKTIVNVGEHMRSPAFVNEMANILQAHDPLESFESHCEVVLNDFKDRKRSHRWKVANLFRHHLEKNGFETKPNSDDMRIREECLDKTRPPYNMQENGWIWLPGEDKSPADEKKREPAPILHWKSQKH